MSADIENKLAELAPWGKALIWVELSRHLVSDFKEKHSIVSDVNDLLSELISAINSRDTLKIESLAQKIEGEDEDDSLLTKSYLFEKESSDWHLYGLIMEAVSLSINVLFTSNIINNVPGWFREEFPSPVNDIFSVAEQGGSLEKVKCFLINR